MPSSLFKVRRVKKKEKKVTIFDTMDPVELERGFLSVTDKKIMLEDRPERFIMRRPPVREVEEVELEVETNWILRNAFADSSISTQVSCNKYYEPPFRKQT